VSYSVCEVRRTVRASSLLVVTFCKNSINAIIKRWEFLEWLHSWQLLKKGSAP
jgi:hypothetical protein